MERLLLSLSVFFSRLPNVMVRLKLPIILFFFAASLQMVHVIYSDTVFDLSPEAFMEEKSPSHLGLEEFRRQFGSDRSVFVIYKPKDGNVFSRESLHAIQKITQKLENWQDLDPSEFPEADLRELGHIRRVISLANIRSLNSKDNALMSERIVPRTLPSHEEELADIKQLALKETDYASVLYSKAGTYGGIIIDTDFGLVPAEDYVSAIDSPSTILDESFNSFDLSYDEEAVVQEIDFEDLDPREYLAFQRALQAIYGQYSDQFEFYAVGEPPLMVELWGVLEQLEKLGYLMVLIFASLLWGLFKSASALVWSLVTIALSVVWCWGISVSFGVEITSMIGLTVLLIFAVGIADCVHVMSAYFSLRNEGVEHSAALAKSYGKVGLPILLTTLTTAVGISVLATSKLEPIREFAFMSALGVVLAFLFTITLLPVLLHQWHPGNPANISGFRKKFIGIWIKQKIAGRSVITISASSALFAIFGWKIGLYLSLVFFVAYWVVTRPEKIFSGVLLIIYRFPTQIILLFALVLGICLYGSTKVFIDTNLNTMFKEGHPLTKAIEVVDSNMAGSQTMKVMINMNRTDGLLDSDVLLAIEALQTSLENNYSETILRTHSIVNIVRASHQLMNNDDPAFYKIPESNPLISQLLILYSAADPEDRRSLMSDDFSRAQISINLRNMGSYDYKKMFSEVEMDIEATFGHLKPTYPNLDVVLTGTVATLMVIGDEIARSQYNGFAMAWLIISVIMVITLGSISGGLMGMIPNAVPALLALGLMGLFAIPLDTDTLLIAPVILGIAVDDTIHFITHYRMALSKSKNINIALESALREVGKAVIFTTMIIGFGFAILSFSDYLGFAKVGLFGALSIFAALLCDLFLIPAMIIIFKPTFHIKHVDKNINYQASGI